MLGYHGCEKSVGEEVLAGNTELTKSDEEHDWLGPGVYFWESDPKRALEWAKDKVSIGKYTEPFVVGAVIDLGNCLDLMSRDSLLTLKRAYEHLKVANEKAGHGALPKNIGKKPDKVRRLLDCAVIKHLHTALKNEGADPFDTVRGLFTEGKPIYPGGGFQEKTHVQISVCSSTAIKGVFRCSN